MASIVVCILSPCSKTSGAGQVHTGFEAEKEVALAQGAPKVWQVPAAGLEGATLPAPKEGSAGDNRQDRQSVQGTILYMLQTQTDISNNYP